MTSRWARERKRQEEYYAAYGHLYRDELARFVLGRAAKFLPAITKEMADA